MAVQALSKFGTEIAWTSTRIVPPFGRSPQRKPNRLSDCSIGRFGLLALSMDVAPYRLFVLRHAHSSWALPGQRDHHRPLDERGKDDAEQLGRVLASECLSLDIAFSSTATRARSTLDLVAPGFQSIGKTEWLDELYAQGSDAYLSAIKSALEAHTVLIVGHNPMIEEFTMSAVREDQEAIDRLRAGMPTCAFAEISCDNGPADIEAGKGRLMRLLLPREMA